MKKIYLVLVIFLFAGGSLMKAQNVLLFEDFELVRFYDTILINSDLTGIFPTNTVGDNKWYSVDQDGDPDASTGGTRPLGWYASFPFSKVDQYETVYGTMSAPDTNTVIVANSWTATLAVQQNWLITSNVQLGSADTLFWKSAPFQTPRYCDGYEVRLSTTTNLENTATFSNLLFTAAQMTALGSDTTYSTFTFSPPSTFVHGADGNNIDIATTTAPILHRGQLRQFSQPLNAFANMAVYVAFIGNSKDDNLVALDDIMIRGTAPTIGVNENASASLEVVLFPNPASDNVQVNYTLTSDSDVTVSLYDVTGKLISSESKGEQAHGRHFAHINTSSLSKGFYTVKVVTANGQSTSKLIVR
ncbi:hypothetical protein BH10BAC1_BH10BAC1_06760 [soil metagenome]